MSDHLPIADEPNDNELRGECVPHPTESLPCDAEVPTPEAASLTEQIEHGMFDEASDDFAYEENSDEEDNEAMMMDEAESADFEVIYDEDDDIEEDDHPAGEHFISEDGDNDPTPVRRSFQRAQASPAKFAPQRLAKLLAAAGIDARRKCEEYVTTGRVTVDGKAITDLAFRADPFSQKIELDGERLKLHRKVYFVLNKPRGVVCTNNDPSGRPRVVDLFPQFKERLFTIGRLDEESEGLLLVTNDGELANRMAHPRYRVPKFYMCHVKGVPSIETLASLKRGMYFDEGKFAVEGVRMKKVVGDSSYLDIVLNEGQNREIRRLLARVNHKVMRLKRVGFGPIRLGDLPGGAFRPLSTDEVSLLTDLSQQRAHLDNTAGKGRKKKFGDKPQFGSANKRPYEGRPPVATKSEYTPRPNRTRDEGQNSNYGNRPAYGQKRYGSQPPSGQSSNYQARPPRRDNSEQSNNELAEFDQAEFNQNDAGSTEATRSRRPAERPQQRGPRQGGGQSRYGNRTPAPPQSGDTPRPSGSRDGGQSSGYGKRPAYGQKRYGSQPPSGQPSNYQARPPRRDYSEQTSNESADNDFGGGRRRFVTEDTPESSFEQRPARPPRPRPGFNQRTSSNETGDADQQRRPARGPRRPTQNRYEQAAGRELPARGQRPARPPQAVTADGKEIIEGKVTGYRTIPKEGIGRRRRIGIQSMQNNRKQRRQQRKKPESE